MLQLIKVDVLKQVKQHDKPIYDVDGIVHYCVANMPSVVPQQVPALNNQTLRYALKLQEGFHRQIQ